MGSGAGSGTGSPSRSSGYSVDTSALQQAGAAAGKLADTVQTLVDAVGRATDVPAAPAGLGVGQSLNDIRPLWQAHLAAIAADLRASGTNLTSTAAAYAKTEGSITTSLNAIGN